MSTKLISYLSFGYPSIDKSLEMAKHYIESGCDMIECDFPTDNAFLDSELISGRMKKALESCSDYDKYFEGIKTLRKLYPQIPLILLAYDHTIRKIGVEKYVDFCKENNTMDMILVGIEDESVKKKLIDNGIKISCYVQYFLDKREIEIAKNSNGFTYMQGKPTNCKPKEGYETLKDCINYLRESGLKNPVYCGVGISTPEDIKMAKDAGADGVFVGSAIMNRQNDIEEMKRYIRLLKEATK
ncbi:tryptophan synthase subunit alpha [Clostridium fallax]|uniref:tryptophan synthase n=1 Tax=Clostridium fallax TaxID=1533 RepID=A0A1M4V8D1_9CLOT|nr:tryptophan synthase subunit alpha [Clostridium fallax]SHE65251.1 tryptophan synthase, alpha chain [Clostridium fallax]SQB05846.1 tryptophan synthase subunit alpha [Clostridium fallax]